MLYKKFLIGIDQTEESLYALKESLKLAEVFNSSIILVSVIPPYTGDLRFMGNVNVLKKLQKIYQENLNKAEKICKEKNFFITKKFLEEGEPYEEIVELTYTSSCDLIVLGKSRRGHVVKRVIGYSPVDILVIPFNSTLSWNKVLVPIDGSKYAENALYKALELSRVLNFSIDVLSVVEIPTSIYAVTPEASEEAIKRMENYLNFLKRKVEEEKKYYSLKTFIREGEEAAEIIIDFIKEHQIELVIMGSHGITGLKRLLMGSVAEKVMESSLVPVLIIKSLN